jgi:hypothetical protein
MNNSFNTKMNQKLKINLNDLSSTSSEFLIDYNKKKSIKQKGGNCSCMDMFKALSNKNLELILYILKQNNCCFKCQNSDGNTILHLLVQFYDSSDEFTEQIDLILNNDCSDFINIKNNLGQTPILLAVMEEHDNLAEKMENAGADVSIEDNNGNFVGSKNDNDDSNVQYTDNNIQQQNEIVSENVPVQNIYNIFNFIVQNPQKPDLLSLGINDILENDSNVTDNMNLNTDDFMREIKNKINNSLDENYQNNNMDNKVNNDDDSSSSSSSEYVDLPEIESSVSSMNTDKFITLLDENKNPSFFNYSDIQDTDQFITILRDKYSSQTNNNKKNNSSNNTIPSQNKDLKKSNPNTNQVNNLKNSNPNINQVNRPSTNQINNDTSDIESSINTQMIKLENESTSDNFIPKNTNIVNVKSNNPMAKNAVSDNTTSDNVTYDNTSFNNALANNTMYDNTTSDNIISNNTKNNQNNQNSLQNSETSMDNVNTTKYDLSKLKDQTTSDDIIVPKNLNKQSNQQSTQQTKNNVESSNTSTNFTNKLNSKTNIFYKNNNNASSQLKNLSSSDIDTNTLLKAIKKIQNNYDNDNENNINISNNLMKGGSSNKQQIMGYRNLNSDSDILFINSKENKLSNIDYNSLYNSDSEHGAKSNENELKRMMTRQKETIHHEVLEMIMGMLNKGLLLQSNKPIEATEKNAKLVKAYIYRKVSEKNPEMGGMDKILSIKTMNDNEIINIVKKMPDLDELEENIRKHLEEKNKNKQNIDTSEASDVSESKDETKNKKSTKKDSKKSTKKDSKKSNKK